MLENVIELLLHKPWTNKGKTYFRLADLWVIYIDTILKNNQRNRLTSKLKQLNGEPYFFNIKGKGVNVWYMDEFITKTRNVTYLI